MYPHRSLILNVDFADLQIFEKFYMTQINLNEFVHNTAYSVSTTLHSRSLPLKKHKHGVLIHS